MRNRGRCATCATRSGVAARSIDLVSGVGDKLATRMIDRELDVVLAAGSIDRPGSAGFHQNHVMNMRMKIVADPQSRPVRKRSIPAADLVSEDWVGFFEDEIIVQQSRHYLALCGLRDALKRNHVGPTERARHFAARDPVEFSRRAVQKVAGAMGGARGR